MQGQTLDLQTSECFHRHKKYNFMTVSRLFLSSNPQRLMKKNQNRMKSNLLLGNATYTYVNIEMYVLIFLGLHATLLLALALIAIFVRHETTQKSCGKQRHKSPLTTSIKVFTTFSLSLSFHPLT